ncbi:YdcF family protein [Pandoraea iniqua]|uniref:YdcF family protein n=1 Tax=Pandoraea iniqua TaxID=2508288 RepID=A0A5E4T996_9BURK|nr:YdcF family protein [Pandoraea iniqua]VVD84836.1 YdcF family protein [Pandoraea iniqua]
MPTDWLIRNLFVSLFLPPANVLVLALLAFACWRRWPRLGRTLSVVAVLAFWLQAMPWVASRVSHGLNVGVPIDVKALDAARQSPEAAAKLPQAVVILGGGTSLGGPEFGRPDGADVSEMTLGRVRYGAFLARRAQLPVLVSGGAPSGYPIAEGRLMAQVLSDEFGVPVRWTEAQSLNTAQNATFSARMLANAGVTRVYLVTSAWHMRRARDQFVRAGLTVVPAPCCNERALDPDAIPGWWPTLDGMRATRVALREWMAIAVGH